MSPKTNKKYLDCILQYSYKYHKYSIKALRSLIYAKLVPSCLLIKN